MNNFPQAKGLDTSESYIKHLKAEVATAGRQKRIAACIRCSLEYLQEPIPRRKRLFHELTIAHGERLARSFLRQFGIPIPRKY